MSIDVRAQNPSGNIIVYDEECFFCSNYVRLLKLQESIGTVTLISARDKAKVEALFLKGYDLNEGMAFIYGNKTYFGADAVHRLALLSTQSGFFNRMNKLVFSHPLLTKLLYPFLKLGRRAYLFLAGKDIIR